MAGAASAWFINTRNEAQTLTVNFQIEKRLFVDQLITLKATRLDGYVYENTYWDEMVSFVRSHDENWASTTLIASTKAVDPSTIWIFNRERKTLFTWSNTNKDHIVPSLDTSRILPYLDKKRTGRWFVRTREGVMELHGATIHSSNDPEHQGPYVGYFIVGRLWDREYLRFLETLAGCSFTIQAPGVMAEESSDFHTITLSLPLYDAQEEAIAQLCGRAPNPLAPTIDSSSKNALFLFGTFSLLSLALILYVLLRWLDAPIHALSRSLVERNSAHLAALLKEQTEFGDIARLIQSFFAQEERLQLDRDNLEKRVDERTRELAHRAYHDTLTDLPNRARFREWLHKAIRQDNKTKQQITVLFIDLDNFKVINDSLGHDAGDSLLCAVARRMLSVLGPSDRLARLGGDEFAVLITGTEAEPAATAQQLCDALLAPIFLGERSICTTVSVGVATREGEESASDLLRNADTAMYHAKFLGKSCHVVFDATMKRQADERLELEADLRKAMEHNDSQLYLEYQPIISLQTGRLTEVEALLRWQHPVRGKIPPNLFIPLAEETGQIHEITSWVLIEACRKMSAWTRDYPTETPLWVSVNLSARCLQQATLVNEVTQCLSETGLAPTQLVLELTESIMTSYPEIATERLNQLRALGIQVAIDDFGTGYSSMSSLANLPVDTIKIDQTFVARCGRYSDAIPILQAMIDLARAMHLKVVSEGIETPEQCNSLTEMGSSHGQGYLFSRPLGAVALESLLAEQSTPILRKAA